MRARDLAAPFPTIRFETPAIEAARLLAGQDLPGLIVVDEVGRPKTILAGTQVLRMAIPRYCQDDPMLARVIDESAADVFLNGLGEATVAEVLPDEHRELPVVTGGATVLEVAAVMAASRVPLAAVVDDRGVVFGAISLDALLDRMLQRVSALAWASVVVFAVAYVLIATEIVHRVAAALGGAVAVLVIGATDPEHAFFSEHAGIDWNVIFLLLGMMLIVVVLKRTGLFEYIAIWAAKRANGRPFRVMVLLVVITAVASAALDNVTTILLIAPVTFVVCERLAVPVVPFLIAEVLASNIGGASTLVGDPPNIIIASPSRGDLSYNDFLVHMAPIALVLMVVFVGMCRLLFRSAFAYDPTRAAQVNALRERDAIRDVPLLLMSLAVLTAVTVAFMLHAVLPLEPSVIALVGGLVLLALSRLDVESVAKDVEWETLVFFAGLFVLIGSLVSTGAIPKVAELVKDNAGDNLLATSMVLLWGSAILSAIVDNIPYVATMSPVVKDLVDAQGPDGQVLWWALALGADLGGNATAVGASANVVMIGMARRAGHPITFWGFTKYGLIVTVVTVALCVPYLWLRYFAWA